MRVTSAVRHPFGEAFERGSIEAPTSPTGFLPTPTPTRRGWTGVTIALTEEKP